MMGHTLGNPCNVEDGVTEWCRGCGKLKSEHPFYPYDNALRKRAGEWLDNNRPKGHDVRLDALEKEFIAVIDEATTVLNDEKIRMLQGLAEYAERINADARDCAYRDRLIEKMRAVLVKVHAHAPNVETSHEIAFLLELPVTRKDDAYKSETDVLREKLREFVGHVAQEPCVIQLTEECEPCALPEVNVPCTSCRARTLLKDLK